jgi:hypothetical protein
MVYNLSIAKLVGRRGEPNIAEQGKKQLVAIFASFEQYVAMRHWRGCCCCASVVVLMGYYWLQTLLSNRTALGGWTNLDAGRHLLGDLRVAAIVGSLSLHRISALKCVVYSVESHRCLPIEGGTVRPVANKLYLPRSPYASADNLARNLPTSPDRRSAALVNAQRISMTDLRAPSHLVCTTSRVEQRVLLASSELALD